MRIIKINKENQRTQLFKFDLLENEGLEKILFHIFSSQPIASYLLVHNFHIAHFIRIFINAIFIECYEKIVVMRNIIVKNDENDTRSNKHWKTSHRTYLYKILINRVGSGEKKKKIMEHLLLSLRSRWVIRCPNFFEMVQRSRRTETRISSRNTTAMEKHRVYHTVFETFHFRHAPIETYFTWARRR